MAKDKIGVLLNEIGSILAQDREYPLEGTFLYAEVEWQMVSPSIFKDLGDHLLYRDAMDDITPVLLDLWEAPPLDKRWATLLYRIHDGKFDASFLYPEEIDPDDGPVERRERILHQRYGNKRIDYPPLI
jgi:hypothetical protein